MKREICSSFLLQRKPTIRYKTSSTLVHTITLVTWLKLEDNNPIIVNLKLLNRVDKAVPNDQLALIHSPRNGDMFRGVVASTPIQ